MATKTQTQTTTAPVLSPARKQLQEVLGAQGRARALADKAAKVVQDAALAVEQARSESVQHDEIAEDAVKSRLAILKGERPAKSPEEIRAAQRNRLIAKEELLASDLTLQAAQQELQEAHDNIARTAKVAASHATSVLGECVTDTIALWDSVNQERERLRVILDSLVMARVALDVLKPEQQHQIIQNAVVGAGLPFGGDAQGWRRIQDKVGGSLSRNYAQPDPGPSIARARAYWAQFADALLEDPAAEQPPLPGAAELFG
jgi:hypothetical protein